jgi:hypothetical protein
VPSFTTIKPGDAKCYHHYRPQEASVIYPIEKNDELKSSIVDEVKARICFFHSKKH